MVIFTLIHLIGPSEWEEQEVRVTRKRRTLTTYSPLEEED